MCTAVFMLLGHHCSWVLLLTPVAACQAICIALGYAPTALITVDFGSGAQDLGARQPVCDSCQDGAAKQRGHDLYGHACRPL